MDLRFFCTRVTQALNVMLDASLPIEHQLNGSGSVSSSASTVSGMASPSSVVIIQPFKTDIELRLDTSPLVNGSRLRIKCTMGALNARWSYRDYRLVMDSLKHSFAPPVSSSAKKPMQASLAPASTESVAAGVASRQAAVSPVLEVPSYGDMDIVFEMDGLALQLIDDSVSELVQVPIINIKLQSLQVQLHSFAQTRRVLCSSSWTIDYYNNRIVCWEPMLEQLGVSVSYHQTPTCVDLLVKSDEKVELNVSHAMLDGLYATISLLTRVEVSYNTAADQVAPLHTREFSPYILSNETGLPMMFAVGSHSTPTQKLANSHKEPVRFDAIAMGSTQASLQAQAIQQKAGTPSISVQIGSDLKLWDPIFSIEVERVGSVVRVAPSLDASVPDLEVLVDVSIENGLKIISLHSKRHVTNDTNMTIELLGQPALSPGCSTWLSLLAPSTDPSRKFDPVVDLRMCPNFRSRATAHLLSSWDGKVFEGEADSKDATLAHTPAHNYSHNWSSSVPLESDQSIFHVVCSPLTDGLQTLYFAIEVDQTSSRTTIQYTIVPPLFVENLTATDMQVRLRTNVGAPSTSAMSLLWDGHLLSRENNMPCHEVDPRRIAEFSIRPYSYLTSYQWSSTVAVDMSVTRTRTSEFDLLEEAHDGTTSEYRTSLRICAEISPSALLGTIVVKLYVPYWIYNMTQWPLFLSTDQQNVAIALSASTGLPTTSRRTSEAAPPLNQRATSIANKTQFNSQASVGASAGTSVVRQSSALTDRYPVMFHWGPASVRQTLEAWKSRRLFVKGATSSWSDGFTIDSIGTTSAVAFLDSPDVLGCVPRVELGVSVQLSAGRYRTFTKIIRITPRFVVVNQLDRPLQFRQCDTDTYAIDSLSPFPRGSGDYGEDSKHEAEEQSDVGMGQLSQASDHTYSKPLIWADHNMAPVIRMRVFEPPRFGPRGVDDEPVLPAPTIFLTERQVDLQSVWSWSGYFEVDKAGDFFMKLRHRDHHDEDLFVQVEVRPYGCTTYIVFSEADMSFPPIVVDNMSLSHTIRFAQSHHLHWQIVEPLSRYEGSQG